MIDRQQAPLILDAVAFNYSLAPIQKVQFDNGSWLFWLNAGSQDVVQIEWVLEAGLWQERQTALAQAVAALLKSGTAQSSSAELNNAIEFYGAALRVSAGNDFTTISLHSLTKHLAKLLPVVKEIITEAIFPENELQLYKQNAQQRLSVSLRKSEFVANRHIDAFLFGRHHPDGRFTEPADLEALNTSDLKAFHRQYYHAGNCRMFMAGRVGNAEVTLLQQYFGDSFWGNAAAEEVSVNHLTTPETQKYHRLTNDQQGV